MRGSRSNPTFQQSGGLTMSYIDFIYSFSEYAMAKMAAMGGVHITLFSLFIIVYESGPGISDMLSTGEGGRSVEMLCVLSYFFAYLTVGVVNRNDDLTLWSTSVHSRCTCFSCDDMAFFLR
jgi:hypothetical protein